MRILLVEDDEFKAADLQKVVEEVELEFSLYRAASVTSALRMITNGKFDACILDMSLPTFDLAGPGGGGSPQSQGGIEVLRLSKRLFHAPQFLIVTQYPDIEIGGTDLPLENAASYLRTEFKIKIAGCLLYEFDNPSWRAPFRKHLLSMNAAFLAVTKLGEQGS